MVVVWQTTFSIDFSWIKMLAFWAKYHLDMFTMVFPDKWVIIGSGSGLALKVKVCPSHGTMIMMMAWHYSDVTMSAMAYEITGISIVYSTVCSGADQRKHQRSASLVFVRGIHRWPVNSPHKRPVTRKMFPFGDVTMSREQLGPTRFSMKE